MEEIKIKCKNCGAEMNASDANCPYCGFLNSYGAEQSYMKKLHQIEEDMANLPDEQFLDVVDEVKDNTKRIGKAAKIEIIFVVIALIVVGMPILYENISLGSYENSTAERIEWKRENYPKMDEMYEKEDYDGLLIYQNNVYGSPEGLYADFMDWEHYDFLEAYESYKNIMNFDEQKINQDNMINPLYSALWFYYEDYDSENCQFTERDLGLIKNQYRPAALELLHNQFCLTDEELDAKEAELRREHSAVLHFEQVEEFAKEVYRKIK